jgi:transposase-like protein
MNTREIAVEYRLSHWAQIMRERQESGLSIKEFYKRAGIHPNVYFYWQRRLREAACRELVPAAQETCQMPGAPSGWVACVRPETKPQSPLTIEIGQYRVRVEPNADADELAKVCRVLSSIC